MKHTVVDLQKICYKYHTASSLKDIFDNIDNKTSLILLKKLISATNSIVCYLHFINAKLLLLLLLLLNVFVN